MSTPTVVAKVYIVRHGETDFNRQGIVQGQIDTPLNDAGVEQAQLAALALQDTPFDVAYSSDLQRARRTAEIILEMHPGVKLETTPALRERYMGDWQGGSIAGRGDPPANIEHISDFTARSMKWWNECVLRHAQRKASELQHKAKATRAPHAQNGHANGSARPNGDGLPETAAEADLYEFEPAHILAVSHGGLIGTLVTNLVGSRKLRAGEGVAIGRCFNASISVVDLYEDGKGVLVSYADTTHLNVDLVQENADVARG
ncbi:phosphoglycerate mutase-like protein [Lentinus tigrinus ALCF2SS1-7]|uniref:Phosphoglycerate mutase-like protein n=1 Tax=Lentinus tigrinus ALCF2SS1-6 TaxID=1328759 RepID=A0A5C2SRG8_9APHY|nr:phosphoglycerate mutase-like protein [Lentinus tigrinus ALCF2SS1-6]RPD80417.1 phosphoglycerate mutase-like protein [Lentinus tigrinus ALCF2SS1-7]